MAPPDDAAESLKGSSPFVVLGLAPTLNVGRVKRAYFAAVARHPPHESPQEFRRVREAYEKLQRPGDLALAYLCAEVSAEEQAECRSGEDAVRGARYDRRVSEMRSAAASAQVGRDKIERFIALAETSSLARMIEVGRSKA